ncbi:hypothetical protein [Bradyrhizobium sp. HKCCYLRH3061]|uniref:hypothetical protein n=1 Tax=unclassified Bradyrhizobium TaxID=2631580 RepID=UPI003EC03A4E
MSDKSPIEILEAMKRHQANLLEQAAAVERDMAEMARLAELAKKYNFVVTAPAQQAPLSTGSSLTLSELIEHYKTNEHSPYHKLSHASRKHYSDILRLVEGDFGSKRLSDIAPWEFSTWHSKWSKGGKLAIAYAKITMVRTLMAFGTEVLKDDQCGRLYGVLCTMKFQVPAARTERLTLDQANNVRAAARAMKRPSISLAQAFQTDVELMQKDVIGEWVPVADKTVSDITDGELKWVRGLRWSEIDVNLTLRHPSTWAGNIEFNLRKAPNVLEELKIQFGFNPEGSRSQLPASGPIIVSEHSKLPWTAPEFRRWWRQVADACGVPSNVRNSDSRKRRVQEKDTEQKRKAK